MRTWMPPWELPFLTSKRLMAELATRRSRTTTPVELSPQMMARLMTREAGCASRLVVTRAPFFSTVPYAIAILSASSAVMSTLMRPTTPSLPKSCALPRDSQMMLLLIWAPDSTVLNG